MGDSTFPGKAKYGSRYQNTVGQNAKMMHSFDQDVITLEIA